MRWGSQAGMAGSRNWCSAAPPPDPPVPSTSLPSGSSVSRGPPRLSVLPAPSAPRRGHPCGAPSRRGRISLFTLSASQLPFLGARGHKMSREGEEREEARVGERQSPRSTLTRGHLPLNWSRAEVGGGWGKEAGWGRERWPEAGASPREGRGRLSLGPGQGPGLQHTVLVHDLLHQFLLLPAQGVELVPG